MGLRAILTAAFGMVIALSVAFLLYRNSELWLPVWELLRPENRKHWGEILELVGALVTALGLLGTFTRGWWGSWGATLRGLGRLAGAGMKFGLWRITRAPRVGDVELTLDKYGRIDQHIQGLAAFVNDLAKRLPRIEDDIVQIAQAVIETRLRIENLKSELVRDQRVDLKWAAIGLLITAVGIAIAYKAGG
jgi:hypothetical protein